MSTSKNIVKSEKGRTQIISELIKETRMIRGTYGKHFRKCGKANCHCTKGEGHESFRIGWTENGKSKTKNFPRGDLEWIKLMTSHYKKFRKNRQVLRKIEKELSDLLDQYEHKIIQKTSQGKEYLK